MLRLNPVQSQTFDRLSEDVFAGRLVEYLCEAVPAYLPLFPAPQRKVIVRNIIARARAFGFEWESSFGLLGDLMLSVAPNLWSDARIGPLLHAARDSDLQFQLATLSQDDWDRAEARRSDVLAWLPPALDGAAGWAPADACLDVMLWDSPKESRVALRGDVARAMSDFGLDNSLDAFCVCAGWVHLYGPDRMDERRHPWLRDILSPAMAGPVRLASLRARVMLDHARRV